MTARGGVPTPTELRNMGQRGVPTPWEKTLDKRSPEILVASLLVDFNQNSKISNSGKFSGFGVAQPDLANGTRFQVQIKKRLTVFHQKLESRAVRKIRLRYTRIN